MSWPYPGLPPDSRAVGTGNPPQDIDQLVDYVLALTGRVGKTRYDPRDFGAVGDGVTDDTAAIQAAINATPANGSVIDLAMAPVSYGISAPISVKNGCTLWGSFVNAPAVTSHLDLTTLGTFAGIAAVADVSGLSTTNTTPTSSYPISIFGVSVDLTNCPVPATTVAAGSNGGTLSGIAAWATPSAGTLAAASAAGFPASGQLIVQTSVGYSLVLYTGISGSSFTGCVFVPGSLGTAGTVATGNTISYATDAFRLMTYGAWVAHCMTKRAPGTGLRFTDANAGGFGITNSAVENRAMENSFSKSGISGFAVDNFTASITDGYCINNILQGKATLVGDAANSSGPGMDMEYSANWQVRGNHVYAAAQDAYVINHGFGTFVQGNDADNFGLAGAAGTTYHGLYLPGIAAGPATSVEGNDIQCNEQGSAAYEYVHLTGASGTTPAAWVNMLGNTLRQQSSASGTSTARVFAGGGATALNVTELGTAIVSPSTAPTISAVNALSGTVNLLHPGATAQNSGSVSLPVGVSSTYGTITNVLLPIFAGAAFTIAGIQVIAGGTFASDVVNCLFTATFDDNTTATFATATQSAPGTQNNQGGQFGNFFKNGRQVVKLQAQARTTQATTSATMNVTAFGTAA